MKVFRGSQPFAVMKFAIKESWLHNLLVQHDKAFRAATIVRKISCLYHTPHPSLLHDLFGYPQACCVCRHPTFRPLVYDIRELHVTFSAFCHFCHCSFIVPPLSLVTGMETRRDTRLSAIYIFKAIWQGTSSNLHLSLPTPTNSLVHRFTCFQTLPAQD